MSETRPRTLFDKIWDGHVVEQLEDGTCLLYIDRHLVHEVTSPQAFEGLRARRPQGAPRRIDHRRGRPQRADHATAASGIEEPESRLQVETLEQQRRRIRRAVFRRARRAPGHRPHHRPGAGLHPARHDDRLRRQPHLDARRAGRAGLRHRHLRGRACAGDADAAAEAGEEHAGRASSGTLAPGVHGQGHRAGDHRQDRHRRRHRPRHRICRRGDPRARHGGAHDGLQHVDRGAAPAPA